MVEVHFSCEVVRLTKERVKSLYKKSYKEVTAERYAVADFPFLETIQKVILDKYLNTDEYIKSYINDVDDIGEIDIGEGQTIDGVVMEYYHELPEQYKIKVAELLGDGSTGANYLSENIEPLYDCYRILVSYVVVPKIQH